MKHYHLPSNSPQEYKMFSGQSFDTSPVPLESSLSLSAKKKKDKTRKQKHAQIYQGEQTLRMHTYGPQTNSSHISVLKPQKDIEILVEL